MARPTDLVQGTLDLLILRTLALQPLSSSPMAVDGYELPPNGQSPDELYNEVSPDYFATIDIPLISGREFTRADDENAPSVTDSNAYLYPRPRLSEVIPLNFKWSCFKLPLVILREFGGDASPSGGAK